MRSLVEGYLAGELVGHISRDSTAITGREKPAKKVAKEPRKLRKRGRPAKGEQREPIVEKRLDRQVQLTAEEAIRELPVTCDRGTKKECQRVQNVLERLQAASGHKRYGTADQCPCHLCFAA